jgi:hypothetical protein
MSNKKYSDKKPKKAKAPNKKIVLDYDQVLQVEQLANIGLNTEQIADFFGFSRDTFYEIRKRQPEVLRHYKKGRSNGLALSANELRKKIVSGDSAANIFHLKTQAGWSVENLKKLSFEIPKKATPINIIDTVIDEIREGNITLVEVKQLTDIAQIKQQLLSNPLQQEQTQSGPSEEFILKHIEKFNEAMRHINEHRAREAENE